MYTQVKCITCDKEFPAATKEVRRGFAKYCNKECFYKRRIPKKIRTPNATCALCAVKFYRSPSKLKKSKSGLFFCCREHKDQAQRLHGLKEIHPKHYNNGNSSSIYRRIAFEVHGKQCQVCKYDTVPEILQVHHIDRNRENNDATNLKVLCPTCHEIEHFMRKDGRYTK